FAVVRAGDHAVVTVRDLVDVAFPDLGCAFHHLAADLDAELISGPSACESGAAAGREQVVTHAVRVDDARPDILCRDAHGLGELHRQGRPGATDVDRTKHEVDSAVR